MQAIVIGGGIIGLSSALYLQQSGWQVTVIDKDGLLNNCSYGNAGYICPSHFIPLATPGIIRQGLKWMWNPQSPFYIQPRASWPLIDWGWKFMRSATPEKVRAAAIPLRDIALFSQRCYMDWQGIAGFDMAYEHKGLLEYFQTPEKEEHAHHTCQQANDLGLDAVVLSREEVQAMEPQTKLAINGALYFKCDAHVYPNKVMGSLIRHLKALGVQFRTHEEVTGFEKNNGRISGVKTNRAMYSPDIIVLASGSWSRELAAGAGLKIPIMPGRGYSITLENSSNKLNYPAVLMEGRVAITPMDGNKIRFGGTMEITATNQPPRMGRVKGIIDAVKRYLPDYHIPMPQEKEVWFGFRPCSADGMPYIGRSKSVTNLVVATGHAMVGMSLGAGTGKLVAEIANELKPSVDLMPFLPERFQ
ncbi:NAD(P)/FAD-dependent oxidoreductase [Flavihumibacter profundi]|uniref:NAD(P)/FAD-dependent oxidoreductase n=1 Tax=Flavihumibacter profundi TaxID=2716883 RepID=UPI001CC342C6|nr:FAD-dependent oxidoreductase [Flavihumibacter profundi]MBZ5855865.1 FAD-dependent oxidoreductase [Flavihumibacter profundi]